MQAPEKINDRLIKQPETTCCRPQDAVSSRRCSALAPGLCPLSRGHGAVAAVLRLFNRGADGEYHGTSCASLGTIGHIYMKI
jgi:hypothetical protein